MPEAPLDHQELPDTMHPMERDSSSKMFKNLLTDVASLSVGSVEPPVN